MSKFTDRLASAVLSGKSTYSGLSQDSTLRNRAASERMEDGETTSFTNPLSKRLVVDERNNGEKIVEMPYKTEEANDEHAAQEMTVSSTAIDKVVYDPDSKTATVTFTSGSKGYDFPDVPMESIRNWLKSASKGRGYWRYIRPYSTNLGRRK